MAYVPKQGREYVAIACKLRFTRCCAGDTYSGTHPTVDGDDHTHDSVTQNTGTDSQFPTQTDSDDGGSDFPVGDSPGVSHPIGDISTPVPCSLGRRDRVEIGVGGILGSRKTAFLLSDFKVEVR